MTFEPQSGTVTWQASAVSAPFNWIVLFDSTSHVKLDGLDFEAVDITWGRLIVLQNLTSHITISNCSLTGILGAITASSLVYGWGYDIVVEDNTLTWGIKGFDTQNPNALAVEKYTVRRNTFNGQTDYAIHLTYTDTAIVNANEIYSASWSASDYTGIRTSVNDFYRISKNLVDVQIGETGIWVTGGAGGTGSRIGNNMVAVRSGGAAFPVGILVNGQNVDVEHNTVRTTQAIGEVISVESLADSISIFNNIFAGDGGAVALAVDDEDAIVASDYNILHSTGPNITEWDGNLNATIGDHRADSRHDFASYNAAVTFVSTAGTNDLHLASPSDSDVRLIAPPRDLVTEDIDGDPRTNYTVTRGADEGQPFAPLDNGDTSSGFFTAGGASPDFATPASALRHLRLRGMKGPVTFRVRPGTYTVQRIIDPPRFLSSETDTVLIRSSDPVTGPCFRWRLITPSRITH